MKNKIFVLFNPYAGDRSGEKKARELGKLYPDADMRFMDITKIKDYSALAKTLRPTDKLIICGGDGTLNRFINDTYPLRLKNDILYYATGNGNDFLNDLKKKPGYKPFRINSFIRNLPTVTVNGETRYFLNGVGFGIDGYCCEVGDRLREKNRKPHYTAIAIEGLLHGYKPTGATVEIDGKTRRYEKVWIAPTMNGRFYGGGMMPTPKQSRSNNRKQVSFAAIHDSGKLHTLCVFPSIFKGTHVKYKNIVDVVSGSHITVTFDSPRALQIDGETVSGVRSYTVNASGKKRMHPESNA